MGRGGEDVSSCRVTEKLQHSGTSQEETLYSWSTLWRNFERGHGTVVRQTT